MLPIACYWSRGLDGRRRMALAGAWRHPIGAEAERNVGFLRARWSTRLLLIGPSLLEARASSTRDWAPHFDSRALSVVDEGRHSTAFHSLFEMLRFESGCEEETANTAATIVRFVEEHCRLARSSAPPHARLADSVERSREFLVDRVVDPFELDDLAAVSCVSKFHLLRLFEREMGMTPRTFQLQLRLMSALAMIAAGVSLSRATFDAGFADQSHLTRRFKESLGVTPGALQRLLATAGREVVDEATHEMSIAAGVAGPLEAPRTIESRSGVHERLNARVA